jgi:sugar/nucleoside kinase (ribokinase family)
LDFVTFGLILDEVPTLAGGHATVLGGGGVQTAFGLRLWSERVGLVARVGHDLPAWAWDWLAAAGIDTAGLTTTEHPTLRARQRLDPAGQRRHEWLVPGPAIAAQLAWSVAALPATYRAPRGIHLGLHPDSPDLALLAHLRALGGALSFEPFRPAGQSPSPEALRALLVAAPIFSPNQAGAESLVGPGEPLDLVRRLAAAGAEVVALRLGAAGSLVSVAPTGQTVSIPALPVEVVDPVGAGNAYCGGFLAGWVETQDPAEAGLRGAVSASFVLEQVGLPAASAGWGEEARQRLALLRPRVERLA